MELILMKLWEAAFHRRGANILAQGVWRFIHGTARLELCAVFVLLVLLQISWPPLAYADDLAACISQKARFDGTIPLTYATVNGSSGSRLYLNANYSDHCSSGDSASCPKTPYLVSGDAVAVGQMCGTRDYVQYIGEKHISEGWVDSAALSPIPPPAPPIPPIIKIGNQTFPSPASHRYHFELTQGKGTPVCEAYQQRLNQTEFYGPPYCGRPESTLVPGFSALQRHYLTVGEYRAIYWDAMEVLNNAPLDHAYIRHKNPDGSTTLVPPPVPISSDFTPAAWTYDPPIDLENSGNGGNALAFTDDDRNFTPCGEMLDQFTGASRRSGPVGIVVSADGKNIDRAATYDLFANPVHLKYPTTITPVEFISGLGVFRYHGLNYFDTFYDLANGDDEGHRVLDVSANNKLGVFLSVRQKRQRICEYNVSAIKQP